MACAPVRRETRHMSGSPGHAAVAPLVSLLACLGAMAAPSPAAAGTVNHPPTGAIVLGPEQPKTGEVVTFTVNASDRDGDAISAVWDVDGDGTFESIGMGAIGRWTQTGPRTVRVRLTDARRRSTIGRRSFEIVNSPPAAPFPVAPAAPLAGEDITLTSQASDPDGGTLELSQTWDLDGDGAFGDATGPVAHVS